MLIIICGLPGTGKTTMARALAKRLGFVHLNTDIIRKKYFKQRKYSEREKMQVYALMFNGAERQLSRSKNVILDATFYKNTQRKKAISLAKKYKIAYFIIECVANENKVRKWIERRKKTKTASEANFSIYKKVKKQFEPIKEKHLRINCEESIDKRVRRVMGWIKESKK